MLNIDFIEIVCGMLYYYGTIQLDEVLTIAVKCGICTPSDFKECMEVISSEIIDKKRAYSYKNCLCYNLLESANIINEMQEYSGVSEYKLFTPEEYFKAGSAYILYTPEMTSLVAYFKGISNKSESYLRNEVTGIWIALNNMCDLLTLTEDTIYNLDLNYVREDMDFFNVLVEINKVANNMPRWFCKGYTYNEAIELGAKYAMM